MFTLAHVVMPEESNLDALPLYVDSEWLAPQPFTSDTPAPVGMTRWGLTLGAHTSASFATYMNAFPAAYWRHDTVVENVRLVLELEGTGRVTVMRSDESGRRYGVARREVSGTQTVALDIELGDCEDGGWIWFELSAGSGDLRLVSGRWETPQEPVRTGVTNIGMTTHNKPEWCVRSLGQLARSPRTLEMLGDVVLVDQGDQHPEDAEGWAEVANALGDQLRVLRQANLGGSGGFTRGMLEAVHRPDTDNVLVLDDDVRLEPEGIRRAITFSRFATAPIVVGGQMCDLNRPSVLHAFSEWVDPETFNWGPTPGTFHKHDFSGYPLLTTRWLHHRADDGYNGWWMCLIPTRALRETGYSLPFFLKWDDAEYGLRAAELGYRTVSFPGAAIWHVAWVDKDDAVDWQVYFHVRNRLVAALLHSHDGVQGTLTSLMFRENLRRCLAMQYSTAALRNKAMRDVLDGPQTLHTGIGTIVPDLRAFAARYPDAVRRPKDSVPEPRIAGVTGGTNPQDGKPTGAALLVFAARALARSLVKPLAKGSNERPQASFQHRYGEWWRTPSFDSCLVPTADDTAYFWYRRNRRQLVRQLAESVRLTRRLRQEWGALRRTYREARGELTGETAWRRTIEQASAAE